MILVVPCYKNAFKNMQTTILGQLLIPLSLIIATYEGPVIRVASGDKQHLTRDDKRDKSLESRDKHESLPWQSEGQ